MDKIYIFSDEDCHQALMFDEETKASFNTVVDAVVHLLKLGISENEVYNYHFSYENGFVSLPCSVWAIIEAKRRM